MIVQVRNISEICFWEILRIAWAWRYARACVGVWWLRRMIKLYNNCLLLRESIEVQFWLIGIQQAKIITRDVRTKKNWITFSEKSQLIGPPAIRPCNVHALFSSTDAPAPPRSPWNYSWNESNFSKKNQKKKKNSTKKFRNFRTSQIGDFASVSTRLAQIDFVKSSFPYDVVQTLSSVIPNSVFLIGPASSPSLKPNLPNP